MGYRQSRWDLAAIGRQLDWLRVTTLGSLSRLLRRLGICFKRARSYIHSPDPYYVEKLGWIQRHLLRAWYAPERYVFLFQDEFTYYRQPTLARAYEARGYRQPLARRSYRPNTCFRVTACLNAVTGQVTYRQHSKITLKNLSDFYAAVRADYPRAEQIYMAQDNWPIHFHPDVLARLQPQEMPWPPRVPDIWPTEPKRQAIHDDLPIQILCLPTYASWNNPIEKLWRWLKQDVLHLHSFSDDWQALKQEVATFPDQFANESDRLLHYVGLLPG